MLSTRSGRGVSSTLVSVVVPAYNCGRFMAEAIESVLAQGHRELELLVVDDGSTDDTPEVVARYGSAVTLIRQANAGAAVARNTGMRAANGRYVAFLDADDVWLPGKLAAQIAHLERHPGVSLSCTRWELLHPDASGHYVIDPALSDRSLSGAPSHTAVTYADLLLDCHVWTSTVLMRRELIDQVGGFNPALRRGQDYDYWLRASRLTPIHRLDTALALYRMGSGHGQRFADKNWELSVIGKALAQWGGIGPDGRGLSARQIRRRLWQLNLNFGYGQLKLGRSGAAQEAFLAALRQRPWHAPTLVRLLVSTLSKWRSRAPSPSACS